MRNFVSLIMIWFIVGCSFFSVLIIPQEGIKAEIVLYVGGTGPGNHSNIQAAIDEASDGDTIFVYNGTYYNNLIINHEISLVGENKNTTIINGSKNNNVITVNANNVSINGFKITNGFWYGIIVQSYHVSIFDNNIFNNDIFGIHLNFTSGYNDISNNEFSGNQMGISIDQSFNNNITSNNISNGKSYGITMYSSENNIIKHNKITGVNVGIHLHSCRNNIINGNNASINGQAGIYIVNSQNNSVSDNNISKNEENGIVITHYARGNIINNNNIFGNNHWGILTEDMSRNNNIKSNNVSNNGRDGIHFRNRCNENIISGNEIFGNFRDGIRINSSSEKNIITGNKIFENQIYGISLSSENNIIYHNNIINNTIQAHKFAGENIWNLSHIYGGNYWSDYNGFDNYSGLNQTLLTNDGIGDTPYILDEIIDHYPLMNPVVISDIIPTELKVPSAPQELQARTGFRYVNLTWEKPYHEIGLNIIEYLIYKGMSIDEERLIDTIENIRYFNDTSVTIGQIYFYRVKAVNIVGKSPFSNHINVVPITTPSAPLNTHIIVDYNYIHLSWETPFDNGGSEISNYTIYRGTIPGELQILAIIDNTTYYNDTEVFEDSYYLYAISAVNEAGEGTPSNEINIITTKAPEIDEVQTLKSIFLLILVILLVITAVIIYITLTKKSKTE